MRGYPCLRRWMFPFFFLFSLHAPLGALPALRTHSTLPQVVWPTPTVLPTRNRIEKVGLRPRSLRPVPSVRSLCWKRVKVLV